MGKAFLSSLLGLSLCARVLCAPTQHAQSHQHLSHGSFAQPHPKADSPQLDLSVDDSGSWSVSVNGNKWLSGDTAPNLFTGTACSTSSDGCATPKPQGPHKFAGYDGFGRYVATELTWQIQNDQNIVTRFYTYDDSSTIVFEQYFPNGWTASSTTSAREEASADMNSVLFKFPTITLADVTPALSYMQYQGAMVGSNVHIGNWNPQSIGVGSGAENTGPLVLFVADNTENATIVLSPASQFMDVNQFLDQSSEGHKLSYGILGSFTAIPKGYSMSVILSAGTGINGAMFSWGQKLLQNYGKTRDITNSDFGLNNLGYSTDNGAFYYYYTETGKNYEDTLIDLKAYTEKINLPIRHILLDSWWYFKGYGNGVKLWEPMPSIFPNGLEYLYNKTQWPVVAHNRYWSNDTLYAKQNGGEWDFIVESDTGFALPMQQEFWTSLIQNAKQWGLATYEQDWLYTETQGLRHMHTNDQTDPLNSGVGIGRTWLMQMGRGAAESGVTIQYCMAWSRHILQSVEIPAVTQARASGDYHPGNTQWKLGLTSIFSHAVGLRPSKDNWWSSPIPTWLDQGRDHELHNRLQGAVAILSTGPYTIGDKIEYVDVDLVMRGCAADGKLLQPDRPATAIDANIKAYANSSVDGPTGEVWSTYTTLAPGFTWFYLLAVENDEFELFPRHVISCPHLRDTVSYVAFEANSTNTIHSFDDSNPISLNATDQWSFEMWTIAPRLPNDWALLGEPNKWVSVSRSRFSQLTTTSVGGLQVQVSGKAGESVTVNFLPPATLSVLEVTCVLGNSGTAVISVPEQTCA